MIRYSCQPGRKMRMRSLRSNPRPDNLVRNGKSGDFANQDAIVRA
jgi:hypothetical protein